MKLIDAEQGSLEWINARLGIPTASEAGAVVARRKSDGKPMQTRTTYAHKLIAERLAGAKPEIVTAAMQRGLDQEPEVVELYEAMTGERVERIGFALDDSGLWGCSPDGLVGDDGLVECKTSAPHIYIADLLEGGVPERFRFQMLCQLQVTGRAWCDLAQYSSPLGNMRVERFSAPPDEVEGMRAEMAQFCAELDELEARALAMMAEWAIAGDMDAAEGF